MLLGSLGNYLLYPVAVVEVERGVNLMNPGFSLQERSALCVVE